MTDEKRGDSHVDPFAGFRVEEKPSVETFAKLTKMVSDLDKAQAEVATAEKDLKTAQEVERRIREHDLPEYMKSLGLEKFTTTAGLAVEVETKIRASIGERKAEAFAWLINNGHGSLIKRVVEVAFNREQTKEAKALLMEQSGKNNAGARLNMRVEPATLLAWVKGQLEEGKTIPMDLFGVFEQRYANIIREKDL